jgi:hypothetical protein
MAQTPLPYAHVCRAFFYLLLPHSPHLLEDRRTGVTPRDSPRDASQLPTPSRVITWGLPGTLSSKPALAESAPVVFGLKVMVNVQLAPGASVFGEIGQVLVSVKPFACAPTMPVLLMARGVPARITDGNNLRSDGRSNFLRTKIQSDE